MNKSSFSFSGRTEPAETTDAVALVAKAAAGGHIITGAFAAPYLPASIAAAEALMSLHGTHWGPEGESRFPVVVRIFQPKEARHAGNSAFRVEMHPLMRHEEALPGLLSHFLGGIAGRLLLKIWGRWSKPISEPTESLMESLGAGHLRFTQFREVLFEAAAQIQSLIGATVKVDFDREGRGAKVVRVRFAIEAPLWISCEVAAPDEPADVDAPRRMTRQQRQSVYMILRSLVVTAGATPMAAMRSLATIPQDGIDGAISDMALKVIERLPRLSLGRSLRGMIPASEMAWGDHDIEYLLDIPGCTHLWDASAPSGPSASRAWSLEAVASALSQSLPLDGACRQIRRALQADVRDGWVHQDDAKAASEVFDAFEGSLKAERCDLDAFTRLLGNKAACTLAVLWDMDAVQGGLRSVIALMEH